MALAAAAVGRAWAQNAGSNAIVKFQPAHAATPPEDYSGSAACAACHHAIFEKHKTTEMAQSGARPAESPVLIAHPTMSFERGNYTYSLRREGGQVNLTVSDGRDQITEPLFIVIGSGAYNQVYYYKHHGEYYRPPVNYYAATGKLGLGEDSTTPPASLDAAMGQHVTADALRSCLRCHSPGAVAGDRFDLDHRVPGDDCESCHGPGAKHVAAMRAGKSGDSLIFNPARLRPEEELDYCGDCHHSIAEVKKGVFRGVRTVIPQAYRLTESRCWNAADPRSRCTFCHDPHAPLLREAAAQDAKCLACHASSAAAPLRADHPGKACPVGQKGCAHCHMPKVSVPGSTMAFTDHRIRIAAPGAPYPE